jgi:hypothetical protein
LKALLLLALALIACETPQPPDCPGTRVAAFHFSRADGGSSCAFYADGGPPQSSDFTAVLAWDPSGTQAALCVQRPYASPALGTHTGDQVAVTSSSEGITPTSCESSCTVTVVEEVSGEVKPGGGAEPTSFVGTLKDRLSGSGGTSCGCGLPCEVTYPLDGGVVQ